MGWRDCWSTFSGKRGQRVGFGHELLVASSSNQHGSAILAATAVHCCPNPTLYSVAVDPTHPTILTEWHRYLLLVLVVRQSATSRTLCQRSHLSLACGRHRWLAYYFVLYIQHLPGTDTM